MTKLVDYDIGTNSQNPQLLHFLNNEDIALLLDRLIHIFRLKLLFAQRLI